MDWIVYADDAIVVIDKPAGLLAVPGRGEAGRDNAAARVQYRFADAQVVHRLDMATSGLMVLARGPEAQRRLSMAFAERRVAKRYVARVRGCPATRAGSITLPLAADWPNRPRQRVDHERGKPSLTHWRLLAPGHSDRDSRLELTPVTGRSHQIRVHLSAIGHPILGDALYGDAECHAAAARLLLHASALTVPHPASGRLLEFASPPEF